MKVLIFMFLLYHSIQFNLKKLNFNNSDEYDRKEKLLIKHR